MNNQNDSLKQHAATANKDIKVIEPLIRYNVAD